MATYRNKAYLNAAAARRGYLKTPAEQRAEAQAKAAKNAAAAPTQGYSGMEALPEWVTDNPLFRLGQTNQRLGGKVLTGALKSVEGIADAALGIGGAVAGIFSDEAKDTVQEWIKFDATEEWIGKHFDQLTQYSYTTEGKAGEVLENVAGAVGQMLPAVAASVATAGAAAPSMGAQAAASLGQKAALATMSVGAAGTSTEEAYRDGAEYYRGLGYGAVRGGTEAVTEKLVGNLGGKLVGKGFADDALKGLTKTTAGRFATEAVGEAAEEALSEIANPATKAIYKGRDAIREYGEDGYLKGVGEAALLGGLTSLAFGGTVGQIGSRGSARLDADVAEIGEIRRKYAKGEGSAAELHAELGNTLSDVERTLKKTTKETRAKLIRNYGLSSMFDSDGSMNADFAARTGLKSVEGQTVTRGGGTAQSGFSEYQSPSLWLNSEKVENDLADINEQLRQDDRENGGTGEIAEVKAFEGTLSEKGQQAFSKMKKAAYALSERSQSGFDLAIVEPNGEFNGVLHNGTVYISADALENGTWLKTLIEETTHFTEGTKEYAKYAKFLAKDPELLAAALDEIVDTKESKKGYGFTEEMAERAVDRLNRATTELENSNVSGIRIRFRLRENPQTGEPFVAVSKESVAELQKYPGETLAAKVRNYLKQFRGTVLPLGATDKAYMRREGEGEYTNPAKSLSEDAYVGKLNAASEFANLLSASKFVEHKPDNGRHPDATRGWNYYELTYVVPIDDTNIKAFKAKIQIKLISKGDCFYDITKIEDITDGAAGQALIKAAGSVYESSTDSIPDPGEKVNSSKEDFLNEKERELFPEWNAHASAGSKEARELEKVKKTFDRVYRENVIAKENTADSGVKYSIAEQKLHRAAWNVDNKGEIQYNKKKVNPRYDFPFLHKNFPPENETQSEAHRLAIWWTRRKDVEIGDQTLISMNGRWYLVERFEDADNGYQVEELIPAKEYGEILKEIKEYGRNGKVKSIQGGFDWYDSINQSSNSFRRKESGVDRTFSGYGREDQEVVRMASSKGKGRERSGRDGDRDRESGGADRQGDSVKEFSERLTPKETTFLSEWNAHASADLLGKDEAFVDKLIREDTTLAEKLLNHISDLASTLKTMGDPAARAEYQRLKKAEKLFLNAVSKAGGQYVNGKIVMRDDDPEQVSEPKFSYIGKTKDGRGIYKSNYPANTPKVIKQKDIIRLVQDVWSQKPIQLQILKDGKMREITVSFNPELTERSDLSKIAFGNRKGNGSEKRITQNLSSDFYHIAESSNYVRSKQETGKNNDAHMDVSEWHYFVTDLVYVEDDGSEIECHMNIDVKERKDGDWFYSFAIEKGVAPQTLLAVVTEDSATTPIGSIPDPEQNVKRKPQFSRVSSSNQKDTSLDGVGDDSANRKSHGASSDASKNRISQESDSVKNKPQFSRVSSSNQKDTSLDGEGRGTNNRISFGVSSDVSNNRISRESDSVKNKPQFSRVSSSNQSELPSRQTSDEEPGFTADARDAIVDTKDYGFTEEMAERAVGKLHRAAWNVDSKGEIQYNKKKVNPRYDFPFLHKNFPPENETQSEAHRLAIWWTRRKDVEIGDQTLISMNGRWYLAERFEDADNGYQVEEFVPAKEFGKIFKEIKQNGRSGQIKSILSTVDGYDRVDQRRDSVEGGEPGTDRSEIKYRRKSEKMVRLDRNEAEGREQSGRDGDGDRESGGADRQGDSVKYENGKIVMRREEDDGQNILLRDHDLGEYMSTGNTQHTRNKKGRMLEAGKKPILTSSSEMQRFINDAIHGKALGEVRAFGKVGRNLAVSIQMKRKSLDLQGRFLEINADNLRESYKRRQFPTEPGDIALSDHEFENVTEAINTFDYVTSVDTHKNRTEVHIAKETNRGYVRIITIVSDERNSLQISKMWGVSKEKFETKYGKKIERATNYRGRQPESSGVSNAATPPPSSETLSKVIIADSQENVKSKPQFSRVPSSNQSDLPSRQESKEEFHDKYTEAQYNNFGWARYAKAISKNELDDMYSKIYERGSLKKFLQSSNGEAIIEVSDDPHANLAVNNVFAFVTGTKNDPKITKVIRFQLETDTEMEFVKEKLYERGAFSNIYYSFLRQEGFAREYSKKSALNYNEYAQKVRRGSGGADSNRADRNGGIERNGSGALEEARSNEITVQSQISRVPSSNQSEVPSRQTSNEELDVERRQLARSVTREKHPNTSSKSPSGISIPDSGEKINSSEEFLNKYSEEQYNNFGWARYAKAISKNESDDVFSKIHEKGSLKKFLQSSNGEAIIEVNDDPHANLAVNNVFVFVTGTKNDPKITKVVRFQVETDTEMEIIKENLYEKGTFSNSYYAFLEQYGLAREYSKKSVLDYTEYERTVRRGSSGADRNRADRNGGIERNGSGALEEARSNEIKGKPQFSRKPSQKPADTVTMSKGKMAKFKANYQGEKVFDRKSVAEALKGIEALNRFPKIRNELTEKLWQGFNNRLDAQGFEIYSEVMYYQIHATLMQETEFEMDTDSVKRMDEQIVKALRDIVGSGKPSVRSALEQRTSVEGFRNQAQFWKKQYDIAKERNKIAGHLMSLAAKMKDLKLGTFLNASQYKSEVFRSSVERLTRINFRGNLNVTGTRKILEDLLSWYQKENPLLCYTDEKHPGLYCREIAEELEWIATGKDRGLSNEELRCLRDDIMPYFIHMVENYNRVWRNGAYEEALPFAKKYVEGIEKVKHSKNGVLKSFRAYFRIFGDPASVMRFADHYDKNGFFTETFEEFRTGAIGAAETEMDLMKGWNDFFAGKKGEKRNISLKSAPDRMGTESWDSINHVFGKEKREKVYALADGRGVFKSYEKEGLSFRFTHNCFNESYSKQKSNYVDFAKMFSVFDSVVENAVKINIHKREQYKPDPTLKNVHVFISAFRDGGAIVPVKLEVKEFTDKPNTLYVAITSEKIKKAEVSKQGTTVNGVAQNFRSANISIANLTRNVNPQDVNFTKYFPTELLSVAQEDALIETAKRSNDEIILEKVREIIKNRRTANQSPTGLSRPVGNAIKNSSSTDSISDSERNVKSQSQKLSSKQYRKHFTEDTVTYNGVQIPVRVGISLYMTLKRRQAWAGLCYSGGQMFLEGERTKIPALTSDPDAKLSEEEMKRMTETASKELYDQFTEQDKRLIRIVEAAFSVCSSLKEKTDRIRFGRSNVMRLGYYFPIRRANVAENVDTFHGEADRVSNLGFNQDTVEGAAGELLIEPLDVVFRRHIKGISLYANLAVPTDNLNRLLNLNTAEDHNSPVSVLSEIKGTPFGNDMKTYLDKLKRDIEGIPTDEKDIKEFNRAVGVVRRGYVKYQLGANPKVWFAQLSSLASATGILSYESVMKGIGVSDTLEEVDRYCKLAELRYSENSVALAQGVIEKTGKAGDALMKPIGWVDRFVVSRLFGACQIQVQKDQGLKLGTEENKKAAGKLLTRVILETQQNSIATERSSAMRSGNELMKSVTMFSADAMKLTGRLIDSIGRVSALRYELKQTDSKDANALQTDLKQARHDFRKSLGAMVISAVMMAAIAYGFRQFYRRDKDKDPEKIAWNVAGDFVGTMIGGLPVLRDVYSYYVDGYELENFIYSTVNDTLDAFGGVLELVSAMAEGQRISDREMATRIRKMLYSASQLAGLPTRNAYNVTSGLIHLFFPETGYRLERLFYEPSYRSDLAKAIEAGDDKMVATVASLMTKERIGSESEATLSAIRSLVAAGYDDVLPRVLGDSITYKGEEIALTAKQKKRFREIYDIADESVDTLVKLARFREADSAIQAKAVRFVYDTYYYLAIEDLMGTESGKNTLFAEAIDIEQLALIVSTARSLSADKDKYGNSVSGSKKAKVIAYIESLRLTAAQKHMILGYLGYKNTNGEAKVRTYINTLNLTRAEKADLLEYSGYTAA